MKKSEITQITQIIEYMVAKEIKKKLPSIIAETFRNMMGKPIVNETKKETIKEQIQSKDSDDIDLNSVGSLKDLYNDPQNINVPKTPQQKVVKQYTKNPILNQVLNETVSDLGMREIFVGAAAFQGGYSPSLASLPEFSGRTVVGTGEMMSPQEEPSFSSNMPSMPNILHSAISQPSIPISQPPILREGQESLHAPMESLPPGVSILDVKQHVPEPVAKALKTNFSHMMKLIDKKKKERAGIR